MRVLQLMLLKYLKAVLSNVPSKLHIKEHGAYQKIPSKSYFYIYSFLFFSFHFIFVKFITVFHIRKLYNIFSDISLQIIFVALF